MNIGSRIKLKRQLCELTLEEVAKRVGVSRQTISRYETGKIPNIPSNMVERLATALNTTPSYLMGWEDENGNKQKSKLRSISRLEDAQLTKEQDDQVSLFIDYLLSKQDKK